jgi:hypothetical protein
MSLFRIWFDREMSPHCFPSTLLDWEIYCNVWLNTPPAKHSSKILSGWRQALLFIRDQSKLRNIHRRVVKSHFTIQHNCQELDIVFYIHSTWPCKLQEHLIVLCFLNSQIIVVHVYICPSVFSSSWFSFTCIPFLVFCLLKILRS